jgi:cyclic pyranopterin phosphate synthase
LTAAGVSALTVYDMVKSLDKSLIIKNLRLILKDGGKSGRYESS